MITKRGTSYFDDGSQCTGLNWGKQGQTQSELWLMKWRNRPHCLICPSCSAVRSHPAVDSRFPCGRVEQAPKAPFPRRAPCCRAGEWRWFTQRLRDSAQPRMWTAVELDGNAGTDCLRLGLSEIVAAHPSEKNLNFQHRGSKSKQTKKA